MNGGKVYNILEKNLNNNLIKIVQNYNLINYEYVQFNKYIISCHLKKVWTSYYNCKQNTERIKTYNELYKNFFNKHKEFYKHNFLIKILKTEN